MRMIVSVLIILMTSWLEGSIGMMTWECPKSTWRTMSQTREPKGLHHGPGMTRCYTAQLASSV